MKSKPINLSKIYLDQAIHHSSFGNRCFTAAYTPYGIKCLDTDFIYRIKNINNQVKEVYELLRKPKTYIGRDGKTHEHSFQMVDVYEPIPLERTQKRCCFGIKVVWFGSDGISIGEEHVFYYHVFPKFNPETRKESISELRKEIKKNPHLHKTIKENLLFNLKSRI